MIGIYLMKKFCFLSFIIMFSAIGPFSVKFKLHVNFNTDLPICAQVFHIVSSLDEIF